MPNTPRKPALHDYQPPRLYNVGMTLRRGFLTGPAGTDSEEELKQIISKADKKD